ncbi:DUF6677 family protein [Salirhabdus sp. Marseille-P4669]|uniref:DUF6677 family protein n=1 Tax=Salirhabdus sp. Marseille-P4669 TaxID=2042310 RepID=UPI000C7AFE21|nr:DUF6677 family protein [Salirhabdus sp. Marseille-P4669]
MNKSKLLAFMLAFIPGLGHIYLQRKVRGILYGLAFAGTVGLGIVLAIVAPSVLVPYGSHYDQMLIGLLLLAIAIWGINMIDMIMTLLSLAGNGQRNVGTEANNELIKADIEQQERFFTIVLSFIPGVGHFHLGLNYRGLTFLVGFFGLATMILFVTILTGQGGFLIFVLGLPIIWIYSLFDTIQLLNRKQNGEVLVDQSIMDDLEIYKENGRKSKGITTVLAIFPGAGHMYLGLQQRGLQLMIGFVLSIYILDILRMSLFLFLIPVIWFYSFFDALQQQAKHEMGTAKDVPVFKYFINHKRWLGVAFILLGLFFIVDSILVPAFADNLYGVFGVDILYYYHRYLQIGIVSILLLGVGVRLLMGIKKHDKVEGK